MINYGLQAVDEASCRLEIWQGEVLSLNKVVLCSDLKPLISQKNEFYVTKWTKARISEFYSRKGSETGKNLSKEAILYN